MAPEACPLCICKRPCSSGATWLNFRVLSHLQRIIDFDTKVANCTLKIGVPQQQLNSPEIFGSFVDEGYFGSSHGVGTIHACVEINARNP